MNRSRARTWGIVVALAVVAAGAFVSIRSTKSHASHTDFPPAKFPQVEGEALFRAICQGCHMADGRGAVGAGAYPALAHNERLRAKEYVIFMILRGRGAMPPLAPSLRDEQVAAVANYVRTHFGNDYREEIAPRDVAANR
ncbi:cytochrome c [Pendulispora brunnea]|uniref:Cytochrome c n=1 Tax=Pendulispora brunnea TaxID=2905690 RepID=A0ABZ2K016_9BACT